MRIQYAISLWNFSHYADVGSLEGELGKIRALRYGVELWNRWPGIQNLYSRALRPRLKKALADMPVSLHTDLVHSFAEHKAQVDAAHDLDARVLVVHSDEFFADDQGTLDVALCRDVVAYAAERGVCIALENGQLPFLEQAIAAADGLRICLDVGHVYLTDVPMRDFLTALRSHLVHLHLQDILLPAEMDIPHAGADHYAPGTGGIPRQDWELLTDTLQEIGFDGTAVFEIRPRNPYQTARLGRRFLGSLLPLGVPSCPPDR
jgi:sugar phosphate isomerase/epimerase